MSEKGIGACVPPGFYTRSQAARLVGRSVDTLKRWHKKDLVKPSSYIQAGSLKVWAYSEEDIGRLVAVAATQKPGRKPKTTKEASDE